MELTRILGHGRIKLLVLLALATIGIPAGAQTPEPGRDDDRCWAGSRARIWQRKTIFNWPIGPLVEDEGEDDDAPDEPLTTDRPDFTEASTTVGRGRIQLEMGYTFTYDRENGVTRREHGYPEALVRFGLFADWLEFRVGQNIGNERTNDNGVRGKAVGADDLYLGMRLALTEQKGWLPEVALTPQMTVPTGSGQRTDGTVLPGLVLTYSWEVVPDCIAFACLTGVNRARDDSGDFYAEISQSASISYSLLPKVGAYTEWFALMPHGARVALPEHYFDGGITFLINNNLQFDIRAGVGLNRAADDFFTGVGFAVRY